MRHLILILALFCAAMTAPLAAEETVKEAMTQESKDHPRIHESMKNLERTIKELEAAPSDFGGHKAEALEACRQAHRQLRLALGYRAEVDEKKEPGQKKEEKKEEKKDAK